MKQEHLVDCMMSRIDPIDPSGDDRALLKRLWRLGLLLSGHDDAAVDLVRAACFRAPWRARRATGEPRRDIRCFTALLAIWTTEIAPRGDVVRERELDLRLRKADTPASNLFANDVLSDVMALEEPQRMAVILTYGEGLGYRDTATVLGSDIADVAGRLALARMSLAGAPGIAEPEGEVSSAVLTAYIDDELDLPTRRGLERDLETTPALDRRLVLLRSGERPFRMSLDALLGSAPLADLDVIRAGLEAGAPAIDDGVPGAGHGSRRFGPKRWFGLWPANRSLLIGAGIAAVLVTALALDDMRRSLTVGSPGPPAGSGSAATWQSAAIAGMVLIATEDLAVRRERLPRDMPSFALVQERLGFDLSRVATIPGLTLKRVHLLRFGSVPIGQLTYLAETGGFVVFCAAVDARPETPLETTRQQGLDIVSWSQGGTSYIVAGDGGSDALRGYAAAIRQKL